jgi:hypothetical protein
MLRNTPAVSLGLVERTDIALPARRSTRSRGFVTLEPEL